MVLPDAQTDTGAHKKVKVEKDHKPSLPVDASDHSAPTNSTLTVDADSFTVDSGKK